jgi:hypothetical protein
VNSTTPMRLQNGAHCCQNGESQTNKIELL